MPMADVIQFRRDTASNWTSANPTLASGEFGYETDTGKIKIGTGALAWNSLGYSTLGALGYALLASPTFTGTVTGPTINASTALQIGGAAVTSTAAELNILDGVTSTAAELNILDGVTSTAAELNILDGVTSTAAELNTLDALSRGSILYGNASGATTVLTKGAADQILKSDGTDIAWANPAASGVSYPQNSKSADYTLVLDDAGKQIFHPASDTTARTWTIPANSSVAFDVGTTIIIVNEKGAGELAISITSDTLTDVKGATGTPYISAGNIMNLLKVGTTKWVLWKEADAYPFTSQVAIGSSGTPWLNAYTWSSAGFGAKLADASTSVAAVANGVNFHPDGDVLGLMLGSSPWCVAYEWDRDGFGSRYSNPSTLPATYGTGYDFAWSPDGDYFCSIHQVSPYTKGVYPWDDSSGFGTAMSNSTGHGNLRSIRFHPDGDLVVLSGDNSGGQKCFVYPWSPGYGTKLSNSQTALTQSVYDSCFSPAGTEIVFTINGSPWIEGYPFSSSGFGTKFSDPSNINYVYNAYGRGIDIHPDGDAVVMTFRQSPYVSAYAFSSSGFGTRYADPATLPTGHGEKCKFSPDGTEVIVTHSSSPYVTAYEWSSANGFGTKLTNPSTLPTATGADIDFNIV